MFDKILIDIGRALRALAERRTFRRKVYFLPGEIGFSVQHNQAFNQDEFDTLIALIAGSKEIGALDQGISAEIKAALYIKEAKQVQLNEKPFLRTRPRVMSV